MSGFTIPNTPDAANQNQAEPDSLDFQILGNQKNGIVSGMTVTPGSGQAVAVASGEVLINGSHYTFGGSSVTLTAYVSTNFFDVIYARVSGGTITCYVAPGIGGVGNPRYPATGSGGGQINPDTDVVLASVWRSVSTAPAANEITDKRILVRSNSSRTNSDTVSSNRGSTGDTYVNTAWAPSTTLASPLSVKVGSTWYNLARYDASGNFSAGTITANLTGTATNASAVPWTGITGIPSLAYNDNGTYTMNIIGASGYLTPNYNVDPLPGISFGTGYIGWSNALGSWSVSGNFYFGSGFYTYSTVTLPYINGYGGVVATGTTNALVRQASNGNLRISSSRRELKTNIEDYSDGLAIIKNLRPRLFNWKPQDDDPEIEITAKRELPEHGFIVEEIFEQYPELVTYLYENDGSKSPVMWKTNDVISILVQSVQELSERLEALEAQ
jgi:hypothetical protein